MSSLVQRAREIHERLRNPPNAVPDTPIDLRPLWRRPEIVEVIAEPIATIEKSPVIAEFVLPYRIGSILPSYSLAYRIPQPSPNKFVEIVNIQRAVCNQYRVTMADLKSARRTANVVLPRQIAMYLARTLTGRSLPHVGRMFGGRDHTTVLHAVRKIEKLRESDSKLVGELEDLTGLLVASVRSNSTQDVPCSSAQTTTA